MLLTTKINFLGFSKLARLVQKTHKTAIQMLQSIIVFTVTCVFTQEKVNNCFELISEVSSKPITSHKRKYDENPSSPSGVIDPIYTSESSNDSWDLDFPLFKRSSRTANEIGIIIEQSFCGSCW